MAEEWGARGVLAFVMTGAGLLLIWTADAAAAGRLKRNQVAGIRVAATLASEEAWRAAHVRARRPTIYGGAACIVGGLVALVPVPMPAVLIGLLVSTAAILGFVLYGARVGVVAARDAAD
ncbi:SdpI family protein [Litorihabitans aurantiacus]|uniref:SdpI family protein n=1 Tax=Litorihabitans aurantiacus TaxID=1930061 RepID=A0AA38CUL8_9MICO|nr:SdpI family protein [Litorihabitans aurantiacus]GMA32874.1 hypothetical protein GCM10025875_28660 [Litorihabitans aurantiacus]